MSARKQTHWQQLRARLPNHNLNDIADYVSRLESALREIDQVLTKDAADHRLFRAERAMAKALVRRVRPIIEGAVKQP